MSDTLLCGAALGARPRLDRLDPRVRVIAAVVAVIVGLSLQSFAVLGVSLLVALTAALASGLSLGDVARRLAHVEGFLVVLALLLPLTVPGPTVAALGPIALSGPGLERAGLMLVRVNLAALTILVLLAGLEPVRLGHALARLGVPAKLVHLLLFAARFVALLREEAGRLVDALRARAFRPTGSRHGLRTLGHFVGGLLVRAFERAERVDEAMRCRAFAGRFALIDGGDWSRADAVFAGLFGLGLALLLAWDRLT